MATHQWPTRRAEPAIAPERRAPDHIPSWVTESVFEPADDPLVWWEELGYGGPECPVPDRDELRHRLRWLSMDAAGVVSAAGTSRFAQVVRVSGHYVLEVGASDILAQVTPAGACAPQFHDVRSLRRVDGRGVVVRVGHGWLLPLDAATDHAWRWVTTGRVSGDGVLHAVR